jgi:hypothetical protein
MGRVAALPREIVGRCLTVWSTLRGTGAAVHGATDIFRTMPDYNFLATLLGTVFGFVAMVSNVYSAYWQRRSVMMAIEARGQENRPEAIPQSAWWINPSVIALFLLSCSLWGRYILSHVTRETSTTIRTVGTDISGSTDIFGHFLQIAITLSVDGNEIYSYFPQKVMAIAFHWPTDTDVDDTPELQKSPVYDIKKSTLTFYIKTADQKFINLLNGGTGINYALIILPTGVGGDSFTTMRQAKMEGAKILGAGSAGIITELHQLR